MSAAFLRALGEILRHVPVVHGTDDGHIDALNEAADRFDALEQEIQDRANAQLQLVADRERLIYWALRMIDMLLKVDGVGVTDSLVDSASLALSDLGYAPHGDRARRMLGLGEPGRRST